MYLRWSRQTRRWRESGRCTRPARHAAPRHPPTVSARAAVIWCRSIVRGASGGRERGRNVGGRPPRETSSLAGAGPCRGDAGTRSAVGCDVHVQQTPVERVVSDGHCGGDGRDHGTVQCELMSPPTPGLLMAAQPCRCRRGATQGRLSSPCSVVIRSWASAGWTRTC